MHVCESLASRGRGGGGIEAPAPRRAGREGFDKPVTGLPKPPRSSVVGSAERPYGRRTACARQPPPYDPVDEGVCRAPEPRRLYGPVPGPRLTCLASRRRLGGRHRPWLPPPPPTPTPGAPFPPSYPGGPALRGPSTRGTSSRRRLESRAPDRGHGSSLSAPRQNNTCLPSPLLTERQLPPRDSLRSLLANHVTGAPLTLSAGARRETGLPRDARDDPANDRPCPDTQVAFRSALPVSSFYRGPS